MVYERKIITLVKDQGFTISLESNRTRGYRANKVVETTKKAKNLLENGSRVATSLHTEEIKSYVSQVLEEHGSKKEKGH